MKITVCVGSSCHLKGSYEVIEELKRVVKEKNLENEVELGASFCLGFCKDGVTVKVDDNIVTGFSGENTAERFEKEILPLI